MALPKAHHIETLSEFNSLKFSYDSTNTHYFTGGTDTIVEGTPDILYTDIAYIKPLSAIYTHAKIYPCPVLEYDNVPTANSSNLVNSGGVYTALCNKADKTNTINGAPLSNAASYFYGVSHSAANATMKEVSIPSITTLNAGQVILVHPTNNSDFIPNATLKLNSFTAYPIKVNNLYVVDANIWCVNFPSVFVFNGANWHFCSRGFYNYPMSVAEGTAGTATELRTVRADYLKQIIQHYVDAKYVVMTDADYAALANKDANTIYLTY